MAIARIDHSGRVGDRRLAELLGWRPGGRHDVRMLPDGAIVSRTLLVHSTSMVASLLFRHYAAQGGVPCLTRTGSS
ncbi:hypothetical protein [Saccharothrix sp. ALI-22-I]|uniref:hypothetical protein n=1 Tax=Saccharothrix sp. ALI-22-I TaxID=1933778 RepID=UPI00117B3969|nr:hypothetical protein [Saccharothrix sp. ALI-22-I]